MASVLVNNQKRVKANVLHEARRQLRDGPGRIKDTEDHGGSKTPIFFTEVNGDMPIVFGTAFVLGRAAVFGSSDLACDLYVSEAVRPPLRGLAHHSAAANAAGSTGEPRAQSVAGFNFAICSISSSSVAQPMKYIQTIS